MKLVHHIGQMGTVHMHVHLGGGNAFVPQHLLYGPKVGPVLQQMGGERMAKRMGTDRFVEPNGFGQSLNDRKDHGPGKLFAPAVQKKDVLESFLNF